MRYPCRGRGGAASREVQSQGPALGAPAGRFDLRGYESPGPTPALRPDAHSARGTRAAVTPALGSGCRLQR